MVRETLVDFFRDFAAIPRTFLVFDDGYRTYRYSYQQVSAAAQRFARKLEASGIAPGERVVFWSENRPEWIAAFWGCVLARVVVVPVDYRASADLLERIAGIVNARAVLTGDAVPARASAWRFADFDWSAEAPDETSNEAPSDTGRSGAELAEIIFTSGATAEPKGVTITHANILANIIPVEREIRKYRKWSLPFAPIRFLNLLPLSHMFGQSMATFIPPVLPGEVLFMNGVNPREIVRLIRARRVSVLVCVPKILDVLRTYILEAVPEAGRPAPPGFKWMRRWWHYRRVHNLLGWKFWSFIAGAAPLSPDLEAFWSNLGFVVVQGYGLTETAPIVTLNHPFHTSQGSVGKPIGGVQVRIAEDGEILVRGANVTSGYFNGSVEDQASFADGWFHTGDIGSVDPDGKMFVRGRKKEMIVLPDGLNVFPEDVERVLNAMPGVRESAVVGSDRVHAVLVLDAGAHAGAVIAKANGLLESQQQIRTVSVWPSGALPRTEGTGKLKRVAIGDWVSGAAPPLDAPGSQRLLADQADETSLAQLGLSSLDRVELMMQSGLDEASFTRAKTVGDLRNAVPGVAELIPFPRWTRSMLVRALRRVSLPLVLLPLLRVFVWLRVSGRENLRDLDGPVVFAVNHQSVFDVPTILAALPARVRYRVATAAGVDWFRAHFQPRTAGRFERFGNHLQYYLSCLFFNTFPLPQTDAGARESLRYMGELVADGVSVILFPEGVRTSSGEIAPFRPGVGLIGSRLNLKIVPVKIEGLDRVLHTSWHFPRPGRVSVAFGQPIAASGEDYVGIAEKVEQAVHAL